MAEALLLAQAAGADPAAVRAAIRGGFAESKILDVHGQRMLERNFVAGGQVRTQLKDMRNILDAAQRAGPAGPGAVESGPAAGQRPGPAGVDTQRSARDWQTHLGEPDPEAGAYRQ